MSTLQYLRFIVQTVIDDANQIDRVVGVVVVKVLRHLLQAELERRIFDCQRKAVQLVYERSHQIGGELLVFRVVVLDFCPGLVLDPAGEDGAHLHGKVLAVVQLLNALLQLIGQLLNLLPHRHLC